MAWSLQRGMQLSEKMQQWRKHLSSHAIRRHRASTLLWYLVHVQSALFASCHKMLPIWADSLHLQMQQACRTHLLQLLVHALIAKHAVWHPNAYMTLSSFQNTMQTEKYRIICKYESRWRTVLAEPYTKLCMLPAHSTWYQRLDSFSATYRQV